MDGRHAQPAAGQRDDPACEVECLPAAGVRDVTREHVFTDHVLSIPPEAPGRPGEICGSFSWLSTFGGISMGAAVTDLEAGRWTIDPVHSEITFRIRHLMTTVRGSFPDFGGEVVIADDPL